MSLAKVTQIAQMDEEILREFKERYDDSGVFIPGQNQAFQGFAGDVLQLEKKIKQVNRLKQEGEYLRAFDKLRGFQEFGVDDFKEFEREASEFVPNDKLKKLERLNENFEEYKKEACVEILEEAIAEGKKKCDKDSLEIWVREKSLKKAFSYVSRNTSGKDGKECAGVFVIEASNKGKIVCQDFRPLKNDEAEEEEKAVGYSDEFKEKLRRREEYSLALMHSHPAHKVSGTEIALSPSRPGNTSGMEQFNNDLLFFHRNDLTLNFIISTTGNEHPQSLYISAISMSIGPVQESSEIKRKTGFHPIKIVNNTGSVARPEISYYNKLVYLWKNSKQFEIDDIDKNLGEYKKFLFE